MVSDRVLVGRLMSVCEPCFDWRELTGIELKLEGQYSDEGFFFLIYSDDNSRASSDNYYIRFPGKHLGKSEGFDSLTDVMMVPNESYSLDFRKRHDVVTKEMAVDEFVKRTKFYSHPLHKLASTLPPQWFARTLFETGNLKVSWETIEDSRAAELEGLQKCTTDFDAPDGYMLVRFNGANVFLCGVDDDFQTASDDSFCYVYGKRSTVSAILAQNSVIHYAEKHVTPSNAICVDHLYGTELIWNNMSEHNAAYELNGWGFRLVEYEGKKLMVSN
jgi:hypothetical protein